MKIIRAQQTLYYKDTYITVSKPRDLTNSIEIKLEDIERVYYKVYAYNRSELWITLKTKEEYLVSDVSLKDVLLAFLDDYLDKSQFPTLTEKINRAEILDLNFANIRTLYFCKSDNSSHICVLPEKNSKLQEYFIQQEDKKKTKHGNTEQNKIYTLSVNDLVKGNFYETVKGEQFQFYDIIETFAVKRCKTENTNLLELKVKGKRKVIRGIQNNQIVVCDSEKTNAFKQLDIINYDNDFEETFTSRLHDIQQDVNEFFVDASERYTLNTFIKENSLLIPKKVEKKWRPLSSKRLIDILFGFAHENKNLTDYIHYYFNVSNNFEENKPLSIKDLCLYKPYEFYSELRVKSHHNFYPSTLCKIVNLGEYYFPFTVKVKAEGLFLSEAEFTIDFHNIEKTNLFIEDTKYFPKLYTQNDFAIEDTMTPFTKKAYYNTYNIQKGQRWLDILNTDLTVDKIDNIVEVISSESFLTKSELNKLAANIKIVENTLSFNATTSLVRVIYLLGAYTSKEALLEDSMYFNANAFMKIIKNICEMVKNKIK